MPRSGTGRVYQRAGSPLWYGDFRSAGGGRESLGTADRKEAEKAFERRKKEIEAARAVQAEKAREAENTRRIEEAVNERVGIRETVTLSAFAAHHLREKAKSGAVTEQWLAVSELHLRAAIQFFDDDPELHAIDVTRAQDYANWLATQPVRRGKAKDRPPLSASSRRKYLNTLSNLFVRAISERRVPAGHNPVANMLDKPTASPREAEWLEAHDAALILESARTWKPKREGIALPCAYPLIATLMLTGGRESEVLGLEVDDVSFDRRTVTFRPNAWRRLKTARSHRVVPLHPQLEAILREYLYGGDVPRVSGLLFPAHRMAKPAMITDWRKALDAIAERVGWKAGEVRTKAFRHTYCSARLQCLDRGAPIALYTVARELGHSSTDMVERVYSHLGQVRHRSEHVEFRVENHIETVDGYAERVRVLAHS